MLAGIGVLWVGYTLTYFGWESLRGPGVGLLDLVVPGRFKGHSSQAGTYHGPGTGVSGGGDGSSAAGGGFVTPSHPGSGVAPNPPKGQGPIAGTPGGGPPAYVPGGAV